MLHRFYRFECTRTFGEEEGFDEGCQFLSSLSFECLQGVGFLPFFFLCWHGGLVCLRN